MVVLAGGEKTLTDVQRRQDISPDRVAEEECRVCDLCIQVIDEKLAEGMSRRFGTGSNENRNQNTHEQPDEAAKPLPPDRNANRAVLTLGRYRCVALRVYVCLGRGWSWFLNVSVFRDATRAEIKESEGNRYIRDNDL